MFCRIKDVNTFTCNICFSKMCVYLCFSTPYIIYQPVYCSGSDAQTTMSQRREDLKAGDIRSCLAVWMADSPRAQERCQLASDTSESWESFSAFLPVFLTFLPSLCCLFVFLCPSTSPTHSLSTLLFFAPLLAAVNQDFYPRFSLLCGCA